MPTRARLEQLPNRGPRLGGTNLPLERSRPAPPPRTDTYERGYSVLLANFALPHCDTNAAPPHNPEALLFRARIDTPWYSALQRTHFRPIVAATSPLRHRFWAHHCR